MRSTPLLRALPVLAMTGACLATLPTCMAQAADFPGPAPLPEAIHDQAVEFGSSWYLRLDLSYAVYDPVEIHRQDGTEFFNETIEDNFAYGIGVGAEFSNWLRGDVTLDYRPSVGITGQTVCTGPTCGGAAFVNNATSLESWLFLANAYLDLGNWHGITPYVGGGIGTVYHESRALTFDIPDAAGVTSINGSDSWQFAWALMAGASVDLSPNFKIDAGYRYVDLGHAISSFRTNTGVSDTGLETTYDDLSAHEFRIGLRYLID